MTQEEISALLDKLYTATSVGDFDLAETMLTDDVVITEADTLPMAGVYRGKTALRELFTNVMGMMVVAGLERGPTMAAADQAVAVVRFLFSDPNLAPAELCEWFRFREGQ